LLFASFVVAFWRDGLETLPVTFAIDRVKYKYEIDFIIRVVAKFIFATIFINIIFSGKEIFNFHVFLQNESQFRKLRQKSKFLSLK
jgi:hypothetical protein